MLPGWQPWGVLLLMGGGFAVASGFQKSKLTNVIGLAIGSQVEAVPPLGLTMVLVLVVTFLTEVTSNTATANIMMPIMAAVAFDTLTNPLMLMLAFSMAGFAAGATATHTPLVATTPAVMLRAYDNDNCTKVEPILSQCLNEGAAVDTEGG